MIMLKIETRINNRYQDIKSVFVTSVFFDFIIFKEEEKLGIENIKPEIATTIMMDSMKSYLSWKRLIDVNAAMINRIDIGNKV